MKLAVFFPGIGYTNDKPLLYYARKMAVKNGYKELCIEYHDLPQKVRGDKDALEKSVEMAYEQALEVAGKIDFERCENILFFGKSIGTVIAARIAAEKNIDAGLVLYTPVEATFGVSIKDAVAFLGEADPWSELSEVKRLAAEKEVPLYLYPDCNHSLECGDVDRDLETLRYVMRITEKFFVRRSGLH